MSPRIKIKAKDFILSRASLSVFVFLGGAGVLGVLSLTPPAVPTTVGAHVGLQRTTSKNLDYSLCRAPGSLLPASTLQCVKHT